MVLDLTGEQNLIGRVKLRVIIKALSTYLELEESDQNKKNISKLAYRKLQGLR